MIVLFGIQFEMGVENPSQGLETHSLKRLRDILREQMLE